MQHIRIVLCDKSEHHFEKGEETAFVGDHCTDVLAVTFSGGQWTSMPEWIGTCVRLRFLLCQKNKLKYLPDCIGNCVHLEHLNCSHNDLFSLPDSIGRCLKLKYLTCYRNRLQRIPESIGNCVFLRKLYITWNCIESLPDTIGRCIRLLELHCNYNLLANIPDSIGLCVELRELLCSHNLLERLPDTIGECVHLLKLHCSANRFTALPASLARLRHIQVFISDGNAIHHIPPNVQRWLDRLNRHRNIDGQNVYSDTQNVHASSVQASLRSSIEFLLTLRGVERDVQDIPISPDARRILVSNIADTTVHSVLEVTYAEIFIRVHELILQLENVQDGYTRLEQELVDGSGQCFAGRLARLVNTMSGLHPSISIQISESEQISSIIIYMRNQHGEEEYREHARARLQELQISNDDIEKWLG